MVMITVIIVHPASKDTLYNTIVGVSTEKYAGRVVDMIAPLFEIMETINSEDGDQEFVNKVIVYSVLGSVAGIGWILACVFCISCCVCVRKRKAAQSMTDYVEFKTNPSI